MSFASPLSSRHQRRYSVLFLAVVTAGSTAMALAYAGTDGGGWLRGCLAQWAGFQGLFLLAGEVAVWAGAAAALFSGARRSIAILWGGAAAVGAVAFALLGSLSAKLIPWLDAPDWLRITLLITTGAGWGLGWGCARLLARIQPPLWSLAMPFLLAVVATAVISGSLGGALALVWLLVVATALGTASWSCLPLCRPGSLSPPPGIVAFAVGVALLGLLARTLGLIHLAYPVSLVGVLAVLPLVLRQKVLAILKTAVRRARSASHPSLASAMLAGALGGVLVAQWIASIAPEVGSDATGGRVALPVIWLRDGVISAQREIILSYMSIGGESFFLLLLPLAGNAVAKIVAFTCLLAILGAILGRGRSWVNAWAMGAAIVFAASTIVWWQFMWGFCDLLQTVIILGAAESLRRWWLRGDDRYVFAAGLLAGASAAVKLNGVLFMIAMVGIPFAVIAVRRRNFRAAMAVALRAAVPAILMVAPALVRSAFLTGNPVFPFANGWFKSPLAPETLVTNHYGFPLGLAAWQDIYRVFLEPQKFVEVGTYHPFLLPLIVGCGVVLCSTTRAARFWIGACLVSAVFWLITEQNLRYSIFVGLFAAFAVARTIAALRRGRGALDWFIPSIAMGLAVIAGITLQLARPSFWLDVGTDYQALPLRWAIGQQTTDAFLRRNQSTYALALALNKAAGAQARVWQMPWIRDHLYFECKAVSIPHGDLRMLEPLITLLPGHGPANLQPAQIAATLRAEGITHLLMDAVNPWESNSAESTWTAVYSPGFIQTWLEPMAADQSLRLYRLRKTPGTTPMRSLGRVTFAENAADFTVGEGRLYDVFLSRMPAVTTGGEYVACAWYDAAGKLLLFQPRMLPLGTPGGWHHWLQTTPPGAKRLEVHLNASDPTCVVEVRVLLSDQGAR